MERNYKKVLKKIIEKKLNDGLYGLDRLNWPNNIFSNLLLTEVFRFPNKSICYIEYKLRNPALNNKIVNMGSFQITEEEIEQALKEFDSFIEFNSWDEDTKETEPKCLHKNKKRVKFDTFEYDYCPDCKKEIK